MVYRRDRRRAEIGEGPRVITVMPDPRTLDASTAPRPLHPAQPRTSPSAAVRKVGWRQCDAGRSVLERLRAFASAGPAQSVEGGRCSADVRLPKWDGLPSVGRSTCHSPVPLPVHALFPPVASDGRSGQRPRSPSCPLGRDGAGGGTQDCAAVWPSAPLVPVTGFRGEARSPQWRCRRAQRWRPSASQGARRRSR